MTKPQHHKKIELEATPREITGHKVHTLRSQGTLPAVLYGKGMDTLSLQVDTKQFEHVLRDAGESTLVYLKVGADQYPTIIHDVSRHPVSGETLHADFHKVRLDQKVKASVPVVFVGESPAVKHFGGIFVRNVNELEVEALPQNLPHEITIDISVLASIDDRILLGQVKVADAELTGNADDILAAVQPAKTEAELEAELAAPTTDVSAVEEIKKEKPAEDAAEGDAATPAEEAK